jgi:hypothetical protein
MDGMSLLKTLAKKKKKVLAALSFCQGFVYSNEKLTNIAS